MEPNGYTQLSQLSEKNTVSLWVISLVTPIDDTIVAICKALDSHSLSIIFELRNSQVSTWFAQLASAAHTARANQETGNRLAKSKGDRTQLLLAPFFFSRAKVNLKTVYYMLYFSLGIFWVPGSSRKESAYLGTRWTPQMPYIVYWTT